MPDANTDTLPFLGIVILVFHLHPFMFVLDVDLSKHSHTHTHTHVSLIEDDEMKLAEYQKKEISSKHGLPNRSYEFLIMLLFFPSYS